MFGWAATRLSLASGEAAETYSKGVVGANFQAPGDADVMAKVRADLAEKGLSFSKAEQRTELGRSDVEGCRQPAQS